MQASIIIITKNQRRYLEQSLPVLMAQDLPGSFEVIVVDSGSTDGAHETIRRSGAKLIEIAAASFGYSLAYNTGMRAASGEFLVRLSGDAVPIRCDWLRRLLSPFADVKVATVWGTQVSPPRLPNYWERILNCHYRNRRQRYSRPTTVLGSNMAIRGRLWRSRPFDECLPQAEDFAWTIYWYRRGYIGLQVSDAPVLHGHDEPLRCAISRSLQQTAVQIGIRAGLLGAR